MHSPGFESVCRVSRQPFLFTHKTGVANYLKNKTYIVHITQGFIQDFWLGGGGGGGEGGGGDIHVRK